MQLIIFTIIITEQQNKIIINKMRGVVFMGKRLNCSRILVLLMCVVLISSMAAGCSPKAEPVENTEAAAGAPAEKVTLTFWYALSGNSGEAFKKQVDEFNASQNEVFVDAVYSGKYADTANKVSAAFASKTEPNGALMSAGPLFTGGRNNYWIGEQIDSDKDFNKEDIYEGMWEYTKYNEKICALPYGISTPILYYNKDILEAAGIDVTKEPKSWEELLSLAEKAQKDGNKNNSDDFWGFDVTDAPWLFKAMLAQNGNTVVELKDGKTAPVFQNESGVEVASFWKKLVDSKVMPQGQHDLAEKKFLAGNLAFVVATSSRIQKWATNEQFKIGAFPLPYTKQPSVPLGGNVLVIFNKDEAADKAAWKFVSYLMSVEKNTEFALATGYLPVHKSALELPETKKVMSENPMYKIAFDQLQNSWAYWHFDQMGTMDGLIYTALEKIEKAVASPGDALKECAESLKKEME